MVNPGLALGDDVDHQQTREKIILAQEIERRKWASEVHDGITQLLVNIYYRLQAYRKLLAKDSVGAQADLDYIEWLVAESIAEARRLIDDLRPSILDDVGLMPAIEKYLNRTEKEDHLSVNLVADPIPRISSEAETAIYRIVQEAVTNVQRHARATHVEVKIATLDNRVIAEIADDGQGFDLAAVNAEEDNWGLIGMKERAEVLGGSLNIRTGPGRGTLVHLELPITS